MEHRLVACLFAVAVAVGFALEEAGLAWSIGVGVALALLPLAALMLMGNRQRSSPDGGRTRD